MNRERWLAIKPSLEKALDLDTEARRAWLSELAVTSPDVADDVEQLLAFEATSGDDGLDRPLMIALANPDATWAGRVIGAYRLERQIGRGGMGSVWLAHATDRTGATVAIKLLNRALLGRAGRERFAREGRVLAQLKHPNIARLIDAGLTDDGQPFLVLEYIVGTSIDRFADQLRCTLEERITLFLAALAGVAHAHANLVVHRDIKPSNILVGDDGVPKLLDFGIAKLLAEGREVADPSSLSRESGSALTPRYAAPEQIRCEPVSAATDVYALGVLLYELISGRHPTSEGCTTAAEQIAAVLDVTPLLMSDCVTAVHARSQEDAHALAALRQSTPDTIHAFCRGTLDRIVAKALAKAPSARHRSVADLASDLANFLNALQGGSAGPSWGSRTRDFVRRHLGRQ